MRFLERDESSQNKRLRSIYHVYGTMAGFPLNADAIVEGLESRWLNIREWA